VIASTHRDLKTCAATGKFRADLFYRLSVISVHLPPLRERGEDLPILISHFLRRYGREMGKETFGIALDALERLRRYSWPGNIRELQSVLKQALLQASGSVMLLSFLPDLSVGSPAYLTEADTPASFDLSIESFIRERIQPDARNIYAESHGELDRFLLAKVLEFTGGSQHRAANHLGISRQTLRFKLRELGMRLTQSVETDKDN
jgi:DNA-binding NtrC family response regulator